MTKDVRRGDLELLPFVFQALVDFEHQITLHQHLEPKTIAAWKDNRDHLMQSWESVATMVASYALTCPERQGSVLTSQRWSVDEEPSRAETEPE